MMKKKATEVDEEADLRSVFRSEYFAQVLCRINIFSKLASFMSLQFSAPSAIFLFQNNFFFLQNIDSWYCWAMRANVCVGGSASYVVSHSMFRDAFYVIVTTQTACQDLRFFSTFSGKHLNSLTGTEMDSLTCGSWKRWFIMFMTFMMVMVIVQVTSMLGTMLTKEELEDFMKEADVVRTRSRGS